ncbi:uncharacterized protein CTHT_0031510 [Thermochaetoides thermophila DSM 1495]|uniref:Ribosomal RNA-processing protein 1 n=1 Tax=Chaetomium thermophilum (strain DSM 1495 / CBS 144.50 / IMI 039719) TaxID=759272 RepID=G0S4M2_CHATD|nr:hypothetical protein CTHT_0031510 [Thermochaetoides thermophila DSM 1495]8I9P_Cc Chain Cc, Ribosomal RNA-processing protein 1 [Thermochaetoides thermophila DSM 1495]8I9R_Cc Chain Cc, Ribosomal RNA-processing protein 1 [Thermochaetoides thermophila DSM 1495]8I9T_Cc Chain Cc, Ribosomal RNA-processing protein 1 [Thermochaetoides thermophila DSM 1495]8I9V_Cc Chain Cc, Ribosomal RNA-processing protein 1 [Thermochaetoides thermophila DSM 1495]EGS21297.1 hypothetical protein CTHT_0031510 [Thermoch
MTSQEKSMPFIKHLASSDRKVRTAALNSLHAFLSARQVASALTTLDVLKLWKGLFYALWMCDRAIPQQNLCNELADLIWQLPRESVATWLRGFWATMAREWTGIDVLRMEKFLLLVRRVLGASFKWMKKDGSLGKRTHDGQEKAVKTGAWDQSKVDEVLGLLAEWPFSLAEEVRITQSSEKGGEIVQKIPVGMRLHVLDIWVDEVERVGLLNEDEEEARMIVQRISDMVDALEQTTKSPAVRTRSKDSLGDDRLPANRRPNSSQDHDTKDMGDSDSWEGFDD